MEGEPVVGQELTVKTTPSGAAATGEYQWLISDTADGTYGEVTGATDSTYTPVKADEGKYIKVKITGKGSYKGTATSEDAVGPVVRIFNTTKKTSHTGIAAAISVAGNGDTILIGSGTYEENIEITKSLILKSVAKHEATIKGYITVTGDNVTIEGLTIEKTTEDKPAIAPTDCSNISIISNKIDGKNKGTAAVENAGIWLTNVGGTDNIIQGNEIVNNKGNGIYVRLNALKNDSCLTIKDNIVENNRTGIVVEGSERAAEVKIIDNTLKANTAHGISIGTAPTGYSLTITGNVFEGNERSHFSDRRYGEDQNTNVTPNRAAIVTDNTIKGLYEWRWDSRWLLEPKEAPTIKANDDLALTSAVDYYDCFTVSTTTGDFGDATVKVKLEATPATGFMLEYVEQNSANSDYGKYLPLTVDENGEAWFGPGTGFPLAAVTDSMFRVTWEEAGEYTFKLVIMAEDDGDFNRELASTTVTVSVIDGEPIAISYATGEKGTYVKVAVEEFQEAVAGASLTQEPISTEVTESGMELDYLVVSELVGGFSHVDNVRFVFEVTKNDGQTINTGDFEITAISLRGEGITEGINSTFKVENNILTGYWGPSKGFCFKEEMVATAFTVKFSSEGTYTVTVKAIQVEAANEADL